MLECLIIMRWTFDTKKDFSCAFYVPKGIFLTHLQEKYVFIYDVLNQSCLHLLQQVSGSFTYLNLATAQISFCLFNIDSDTFNT